MSRKSGMGQTAMIESLEGRTLFTALPVGVVAPTPEFANGVVNIKGTKYDDRIMISLDSDGVGVDVNINGEVSAFFRSMVHGFLINGGKGNDVVQVDESNGAVEFPITFVGGGGKDVLLGTGTRS